MSEDKKRKWELEYERLKTVNLDKMITDLATEVREGDPKIRRDLAAIKDPNSEEYKKKRQELGKFDAKRKEIARLQRLKANLPKAANILKMRNAQQAKVEKLLTEKKEAEKLKGISDKSAQLEQELIALQKRERELEADIKKLDPKKESEKIKELKTKLTENREAQNKNQLDFAENQNALSEKLKNPLLKRDFDKEIRAAKKTISKCNFVGRLLMEGKSIEEIQFNLENWQDRRFVDPSKKLPKRKDELKGKKPEKEGESESPSPKPVKKDKPIGDRKVTGDEVLEESEDRSPITPVEVSTFAQRHPRLAKIANFFRHPIETIRSIRTQRKKDVTDISPEETKGGGKLTKEEIAAKKADLKARKGRTGSYMKRQSDFDRAAAAEAGEDIKLDPEDRTILYYLRQANKGSLVKDESELARLAAQEAARRAAERGETGGEEK